jgi:hypothetical protein
MPATQSRYTALAVHWADRPDHPEFLAVEGRLLLFDTLEIARQTVPRFGSGRQEVWDAAREVIQFLPAALPHSGAFNRISLYPGYDPYDVPNGFRAKGVYSEGRGRDWRSHIYWRHALEALVAWADQINARVGDACPSQEKGAAL